MRLFIFVAGINNNNSPQRHRDRGHEAGLVSPGAETLCLLLSVEKKKGTKFLRTLDYWAFSRIERIEL